MIRLIRWVATGRRIGDRMVFDKLLQVLRFGCSYEAIADSSVLGHYDP